MARKSSEITNSTTQHIAGQVAKITNGQVGRQGNSPEVIEGKALPITQAQYNAAKQAFSKANVTAVEAVKTLRVITEAEGYNRFGFEGPKELFADFLNGLALPGKMTVGDNLAIVAALIRQGVKQDDIAAMVGMAQKGSVAYVKKIAVESGLLPDNGNGGNGTSDSEKVNGGKAKVTDDGLVKLPSFSATRDNATKIVAYLKRYGVTIDLPESA